MSYVVPSLLVKTKGEAEARLNAVRPHLLRIQIDVLNNTLFPNESFADPEFIGENIGDMRAEVHLMVELDGYDVAQWDREWVRRIIFHYESADNLVPYIEQVHAMKKNVFIALNPETSIDKIEPLLSKIDGVLFMTVNPGFNGAPFVPEVISKIQDFKSKHPDVHVEVDGGVSLDTIPALLSAGVKGLAIGSFLENDKIEDKLFEIIPIIERYEKKE